MPSILDLGNSEFLLSLYKITNAWEGQGVEKIYTRHI